MSQNWSEGTEQETQGHEVLLEGLAVELIYKERSKYTLEGLGF